MRQGLRVNDVTSDQTADRSGPYFRDLMTALGFLLFNWARLEGILGDGPKPTGALAGEIRHLRAQRNIIVHGLVSGETDPIAGSGSIRCKRNRKPTGSQPEKVYTLAELRDLAEAMDQCRLRIHRSR